MYEVYEIKVEKSIYEEKEKRKSRGKREEEL
jgi:hypothetical protein